jgi:arsenate reductase
MSAITIYHNPACGTSRNTLELIRNSGVEPTVILYLETPPARAELVRLIADMGICVRALLRKMWSLMSNWAWQRINGVTMS